MRDVVRRFFAQRHTPPFEDHLPGTMQEVVAAESRRRRLKYDFRLVRRWLSWQALGQWRLLRDRLPPPPARLLWANLDLHAVGDSLMDLAGRSLLAEHRVDLLTDVRNADLYRADRFIERVFTDSEEIKASDYAFLLVSRLNGKALIIKYRRCRHVPFAAVQGFFYGSDFNRILFSCYRIHQLLGCPLPAEALRPHLRERLYVDDEPTPLPPASGRGRVALAVGGTDPIRRYRRWPEVIRWLRTRWPAGESFPEFVLVGSHNGLEDLAPVLSALDGKSVNFVGRLSLRATARAIQECALFVGSDGGLMHCASALDRPGVALFGRIRPELRLPPVSGLRGLYDAADVNGNDPSIVADAILDRWRASASAGAADRRPTG